MAANHAASHGCSLSPRCARASTGTRWVSRRNWTPPDRGASRQQQRMIPVREEVKSQARTTLPARCWGGARPLDRFLSSAASVRDSRQSDCAKTGLFRGRCLRRRCPGLA
jgi:hypothetical protein